MKYLSQALNGINTALFFLYIDILLLYIVLNFYGCYQIAFFSFASNCWVTKMYLLPLCFSCFCFLFSILYDVLTSSHLLTYLSPLCQVYDFNPTEHHGWKTTHTLCLMCMFRTHTMLILLPWSIMTLFTKHHHMCYQLWHGFVSKSRSECISSKVILYIVGVKTPILQRGNLMHSTSRVWVYYTSKRKLYIWYTILQRGSPTWNMSWVLAHNNSQRKPYIHAVHRLQRGNLTCSMSWVWAHHLSERKPYVQCTILQRGNLMCCMSWVCVHHTSERKPYVLHVMGVCTPYFREETLCAACHGCVYTILQRGSCMCSTPSTP